MIQEAGDGEVVWTGTEAEVLALIKQVGGGPKTVVCHNCGKPGHWPRECKEAKRDRFKGGLSNWKRTPPSARTPATESVNGKTFKWYAKCGCWTTTHDAETHPGGRTDSKDPSESGSGRKRFSLEL